MILCGHGGYCARVPDHAGAHTADPPPKTREWDRRYATVYLDARLDRCLILVRAVGDAASLALLDFKAPEWANLRDPL
jgi:hypothetical protein